MRNILLFLLFFLGARQQSLAQTNSLQLGIISEAVGKLGGATAYSGLQDATVHAACTRIRGNTNTTKHVRWVFADHGSRYNTEENPHSGMIHGPSGDYLMAGGKAKPVEARVVYAMQPYYLPGLMLTRALDAKKYEVSEVTNEVQSPHLRIRDLAQSQYPEISVQDWYFDSSTGFPTSVEYPLPTTSNGHHIVTVTLYFSDFKSFQGMVIPMTLHESINGNPSSTCVVSAFESNTSPTASLFAVPDGGAQ